MGLNEADGARLKFIHGAIADGAMAFLKQEYKFLTIFMVVFAAVIAILIDDTHTPDIREGVYTALAFSIWRSYIDCVGIYRYEGSYPG
jgi:Na+/H+-translocating membrane pyrophosphatase